MLLFSRYYRSGSNLVLDAGPYVKALEVSCYLFFFFFLSISWMFENGYFSISLNSLVIPV